MKVLIFGATGMVGQGVLRECLRDLDAKGQSETERRERLKAMREFVEMLTSLYMQMSALPTGAIRRLISAQGKVRSRLSGGARASAGPSDPA